MMGDLVAAYVTLGVGVVVLALLVLRVLPSARRFARANADLRAGVATGTGSLRALRAARRPGGG